ncbi:MAG: DUF4419 domain-containing protein [Spirochaetota bacterium]
MEATINKITFQVEDIQKASYLLEEYEVESILHEFSKTINQSEANHQSLVYAGSHAFLLGMHRAYADHRPFVLSPDMIWLLISQGFSKHVNYNSEALRDQIVGFQDKTTLTVQYGEIAKQNPDKVWPLIISEFRKKMSEYTKGDLIEVLSANFTTTTEVEKIVNEITIMDTLKPYFKFVVEMLICGIPEITLEGSVEDWEKIIAKIKALGKYNLSWWTNELLPILQKIKRTANREIDVDFWRHMFKIHSVEGYGSEEYIDGWIVKFFPYDGKGEKKSLDRLYLSDIEDLPDEICRVEFLIKLITPSGETVAEYEKEFSAGFMGLSQNHTSLALRPEMGWFINPLVKRNHEFEHDARDPIGSTVIFANLKEFPPEILKTKQLDCVRLDFLGKILIPEEIKDIKIRTLFLRGKIDSQGEERIKKLLPNTNLYINAKELNQSDWEEDEFPSNF